MAFRLVCRSPEQRVAHRLGQQQIPPKRFAQRFHPAGFVDGPADHGEVEPFLAADIAEKHFAPMQADADFQRVPQRRVRQAVRRRLVEGVYRL